MVLIDDTRRLAQGASAVAATRLGPLIRRKRQSGVLVVAFSRDRPLQLELLLESYSTYVDAAPPVTLLYRASTDAYRSAYTEVLARYAGVVAEARPETDFRSDLLAVLRGSHAANLMFLVDDLVFIRPLEGRVLRDWSSKEGILSLRLGTNISSSYNAGVERLAPPETLRPAHQLGVPMVTWRWNSGTVDWQLALSLDGHLLPKPLLQQLIERSRFHAPNSLEAALGRFRFLFKGSWGFAYPTSRVVNLPLNSVKGEDYSFPNLGGDARALLDGHLRGLRLDASTLPLEHQTSCHIPWAPALVPREAARQASDRELTPDAPLCTTAS